jgi:hypothetical protein
MRGWGPEFYQQWSGNRPPPWGRQNSPALGRYRRPSGIVLFLLKNGASCDTQDGSTAANSPLTEAVYLLHKNRHRTELSRKHLRIAEKPHVLVCAGGAGRPVSLPQYWSVGAWRAAAGSTRNPDRANSALWVTPVLCDEANTINA